MAIDVKYRAQVNIIRATAKLIKFPAAVTRAIKELDAVSANRATLEADAAEARAASYAAALKGELTLDLVARSNAAAGAGPVIDAAEEEAARSLIATSARHGDETIKTIRDTLFTPALEALQATASRIKAGDTVEALVKQGRADDAKALVDAHGHYKQLTTARQQRQHYTTAGTKGSKYVQWRNPEQINDEWADTAHEPDETIRFLNALRAGGEAWLPTSAELQAINDTEHADRLAARQSREQSVRNRFDFLGV